VIYGYPEQSSVRPGEHVTFRVSTDAPAFRVLIHRCGAEREFMGGSELFAGCARPHHLPFQDWGRPGVGLHGEELPGWADYDVPVPRNWSSGPYVAVFVEHRNSAGSTPCSSTLGTPHAQALFVVREGERAGGARINAAQILYKIPLFTYHAYNHVTPDGGWCLYNVPDPVDLSRPVPPSVSLHRPGGGVGAAPWDIVNFDPFDPTPRQTFAHWDAPFVAWAERSGYRLDFCTDLDLHRDAGLLDRYRLLVSAGHDEYWSDAMRSHVEEFVHRGGNVAFFSGNTCWWRITFDDNGAFRRVANWSDASGPDRPENLLTGVSFRNGGERDRNDHPVAVGYRVQHADHWVYAGTGLRDGDVFGARPDEYLVGYECDGAHFDRTTLARRLPIRPTGDDGTPPGFTILGIGDAGASGWGLGNKAATMGLHCVGGTVFNAATTDWPRVLAAGGCPPVEQVTRNVLDRLGAYSG